LNAFVVAVAAAVVDGNWLVCSVVDDNPVDNLLQDVFLSMAAFGRLTFLPLVLCE
jgi:hypothetical protein